MGNVEFLSSHRARRNDDILDDILFILRCMGGAAHFNAIKTAVEAKLRQDRREISRSIGSDILGILQAYDLDNPDCLDPALFRRPFGPDSQRWAILGA